MTNPLPNYTDLSWARASANAARTDAQDYFTCALRYASYKDGECFTLARQYVERALVKCAQLASLNEQIRQLEKPAKHAENYEFGANKIINYTIKE